MDPDDLPEPFGDEARTRKPVGDELLGLLVDLALGPGPELTERPIHLLGELVGRPRLDREQSEDRVRRRRESLGH